jgi:hypothetical protein
MRWDSEIRTAYANAGQVQCGFERSGNTVYVEVDPKTSYTMRPQGVAYLVTGNK